MKHKKIVAKSWLLTVLSRRPVQIGLAVSLALLVGLGAVVGTSGWFHEQIGKLRHDFYATLYVDPEFRVIADRRRNLSYCDTDSRFQQLDLYRPKSAPVGLAVPAVVYIHGGGWSVGDKASAMLPKYGVDVVESGMALVSINYRLAPDNTYPAQNIDVACALDYLRLHARDLGIDASKIGLWGDSAGGQLAAMAALSRSHRDMIAGVVEFYGTADIWTQITRKSGVDRRALAYIGSADHTLADRASPLKTRLTDMAGAAPFLLFHGKNDRTVAYGQSVALAARLNQAGVQAQLRTVEHANHNFSSASRPTADEINQEMVAFFQRHLER